MPANWTLDNFREVLDPRTLEALGNSVVLAAGAAVGVIVLAGLAVMARRGRGAGLTGGLLGLTFALPGSTLAVAVLLAYGVALRDTLLIILIAYLAKFWALGLPARGRRASTASRPTPTARRGSRAPAPGPRRAPWSCRCCGR